METEKIQKLYQLNVELEGLLRVLEQRDSHAARKLLGETFEAYSAAMRELLGLPVETGKPTVVTGDAKSEQPAETPVDTAADAAAETAYDVPDDAAAGATLDKLIENTEHALDKASHTEVKEQEAVESEEDRPMDPPHVAAVDPVMGRTVTSRVVSSIKVDEMVARNESADLRKAFTLNDKFRFRRELFEGSDDAFNHTLDLLQSMHDYRQAYDYLTGDLQLDENNEAVADFLTIIKRHFPA